MTEKPSSPVDIDVFDRLRMQKEVDLAQELGLLRAAILELHARLPKSK